MIPGRKILEDLVTEATYLASDARYGAGADPDRLDRLAENLHSVLDEKEQVHVLAYMDEDGSLGARVYGDKEAAWTDQFEVGDGETTTVIECEVRR